LIAVDVLSRNGVRYPAPDAGFSPDEAFPEFGGGALSSEPNPVYAMVRDLLAQAGLDADRHGRAEWNPLGDLIAPGSSVFVLCNFVYHRRPNESAEDFDGKCIHGSVLRALIDYALIAVGPGGRVRFGNAPLQSCDWKAVQHDTGADAVARYYAERSLPVEARDLRLFVTARGGAGGMQMLERRDPAAVAEIDLADESLLAELDPERGDARFRVSDYDPARTESCHRGGSHRYLVHREVLDSDVVISLPKLKTHEKVGITCGLKGFVGAVGHKDCLAHHRFGSPDVGGDEYPSALRLLRPLSAFHDAVYRRPPDAPLQRLATGVDRLLRTAVRRAGAITTGAWHGNDTAWRMALDLARILRYADREGVLRDRPQRSHLSLIDGIVAGEAEGPLDPRALRAGTLVFGSDVAAADRVACRLMGYDPATIPLIREAFRGGVRPVSDVAPGASIACRVDGREVAEPALEPVAGRRFAPPAGWRPVLGGR
jgi:uncharacterized protein (DUF362 family)